MAFPQKVRIGSAVNEFPGASWNAIIDKLNALESRRSGGPQQRGSAPFAQCPRLVVRVHNTLSTTLQPGHILGFSEPIISPDDAENGPYGIPGVKGITPATPEHDSQFVVLLDGIRGTTDSPSGTAGAIGPAVLMGLAWVKVNFTDDAHTKVAVVEGETQLQSAASGITPVWIAEIPEPEELPADVWALIQMGGGGGSSTGSFRRACVAVRVGAATSSITDGWSTDGAVFYLNEAGEVIFDGPNLDGSSNVVNQWRTEYVYRCQVAVDSDGYVQYGDCFPPALGYWVGLDDIE